MRKLQRLILIICFICQAINGKSQDAFFSQFFANRLYLNPAWAGIGDEKRLFMNYRNQYPSIGSVYKTYTLSYDQYVEALNGGLGFSVSDDVQGAGAINQLAFSAMYSYSFKVGRSLSLAGGLQTTGISRSINASGFEFGDQYNPNTGEVNMGGGSEIYGNSSKIFPDFSAGLAGFYKKSYGGISMFHLLKPYQSESTNPESRLPRKLTLFVGTYIPVYEKRLGKEVLQLNPNLIFIQQKNLNQLFYGLETLYKERFVSGIWLRQNLGFKYSALIFSVGISFDNLRLRYSYDAGFSKPSVQIPTMGSHEISMIIALAENKKIKHKAIKCPKF
jgi:type IX secretion system PorP/SprF family membrane protein